MAKTVQQSFDEFLVRSVRLDPDQNNNAKTSKDELLKQIQKLPADGDFPELHNIIPFIQYGSYSRKTKIRPLDDIDLMVVLDAKGSTYDSSINPSDVHNQFDVATFRQFRDANGRINSTKVINTFIKNLSKIHLYRKADFKKNQEAAVLELQSYEWVYDIVPCFITKPEPNGKTYFLIPDGKGAWKKTDPRVDKDRVAKVKGTHNISILDVIRLCKYWNVRPTMPTMGSYLLENMVLDYFEFNGAFSQLSSIKVGFLYALNHIRNAVNNIVLDPKGLQGDLNNLTLDEKDKISRRAEADYNKGNQAMRLELSGYHEQAIAIWREIFGSNFPLYTN
ncbi:nucleotidyltransferase [Chitinophaga silvisoli]|uniref:Nucleotidyltransferase n=1 Tax=Chitinophaga silvisoli TaxID=2291814 RepID=A0A3E1NVK1_9BACT|nr:nucleotidyltransferase [Chitinophaga silvisoli]RFM31936.1 nucleotidyltransferase [Chitinophaga silvisoli]